MAKIPRISAGVSVVCGMQCIDVRPRGCECMATSCSEHVTSCVITTDIPQLFMAFHIPAGTKGSA